LKNITIATIKIAFVLIKNAIRTQLELYFDKIEVSRIKKLNNKLFKKNR